MSETAGVMAAGIQDNEVPVDRPSTFWERTANHGAGFRCGPRCLKQMLRNLVLRYRQTPPAQRVIGFILLGVVLTMPLSMHGLQSAHLRGRARGHDGQALGDAPVQGRRPG
ncbi:MAG: hypothetical protein MO853_09195 [Candidatus Protistobacter heckmanni]|nr:hypothetical protein [Candidatus Protistobacter heckmanni]